MVWFKEPVLVATNMVEHVQRSRLGHLALLPQSCLMLTIQTRCKLKLWSSAASLAALSYITRLQYEITGKLSANIRSWRLG